MFVDGAVLKEYERRARIDAIQDHSLMVDTAVQVGLKISTHRAMHGTGQKTENHPVGMMDPAPRQLEAMAQGDFLQRILDRVDHLVDRKDLTDWRVF